VTASAARATVPRWRSTSGDARLSQEAAVPFNCSRCHCLYFPSLLSLQALRLQSAVCAFQVARDAMAPRRQMSMKSYDCSASAATRRSARSIRQTLALPVQLSMNVKLAFYTQPTRSTHQCERSRCERRHLATRHVSAWHRRYGTVRRFPGSLREDLRRTSMLYVAGIVAAVLFVYLFAALIRPEWF